MLIENEKVPKTHLMGLIHQTLAGKTQGLETLEVWLITLPPGAESPENSHFGEVVWVTLKGSGRAVVEGRHFRLAPNTTLIIPARATRQAINDGTEDLTVLVLRSLVPPPGKTTMEAVRGLV